jgi:hypothetical protein
MDRQGLRYLIHYGNNAEIIAFIPVGKDIHEHVRTYYPFIKHEFCTTQHGEREDGAWVTIKEDGYEDCNVFLPTGQRHIITNDDFIPMFIYFFAGDNSFMKKRPPR